MPWKIGDATLALEYVLDTADTSPENNICGYWLEASDKGVSLEDVCDALGVPQGTMKQQLGSLWGGLQINGVYTAFDFETKELVVGARCRISGDAETVDYFLLLQVGKAAANASGEQFVFGLALTSDDLTLSKLPLIGQHMHVLDFISVDVVCLLASNDSLANYTLPSLPFYRDGETQDPFSAIAGAGSLPLSAGTAGEAVIAAAGVFSLDRLLDAAGDTHPELKQARKLLPKNSFPAVLLAGEVAFGEDPGVSAEAVLSDISVPASDGKTLMKIQDAGMLFKDSKSGGLVFEILGTLGVPLPCSKAATNFTGGLALTENEIEGFFSVEVNPPPRIPGTNIYLGEVGLEVGVTFEPDGVDLGVETKFSLSPSTRGNYELAAMGSIDAAGDIPIPNLNCFVVQIPKLTFSTLCEMICITPPQPASMFPDKFALSNFYVAWSESLGGSNILPDGTAMAGGFAVSTMVRVASFTGLISTNIDTTGDFDMKGQCSPIYWHGLSLTGGGKAVCTTEIQVKVKNQYVWQPVMTLPKAGSKTRSVQVIKAGGPSLWIRTNRSPYIDIQMDVTLINDKIVAEKVIVASNRVTFSVELRLPAPFDENEIALACSLEDDGIAASGSLGFDIELAKGDLVLTFEINSRNFYLRVHICVEVLRISVHKTITFDKPLSAKKLVDEICDAISDIV